MFGFKTDFSKNSSLAVFLIAILAGAAVLWLAPRRAPHPVVPGHATAPDTNEEKAKNAQCARDVCSIVLTKEANGPDVNCDLAHRWQAKEIRMLAEFEGRVMVARTGAVQPQGQRETRRHPRRCHVA